MKVKSINTFTSVTAVNTLVTVNMKFLTSTVAIFCVLNFVNCDKPRIAARTTPPATDARNLHDAMVGLGTNEDRIIHILGDQTNAERQLVIKEYLKLFNKDLVTDLKNELSGNLKLAVKALLREPDVYLAKEVKRALTAVITDDDTLAEVLCTRTKNELLPIMDAFQKRYNKTLLTQLDESLEGDKRTFYKAIITGTIRDQGGEVNTVEARNQVNIIPNAADYCTVPQNHPLMLLFAKAKFEHIHFVSVLHEQAKGKTVEEQLKRWCNDDGLTHAYLTTVRFSKDPIKFYAEELSKAMAGIQNPLVNIGTNDDKLIRIIVSRSEIDLHSIKNKYNQLYNTTLPAAIEDETSGDYRKLLLRIIEKSDLWSS